MEMTPKKGRPITYGADDPARNRRRMLQRESKRRARLRKIGVYGAVETLPSITQQQQQDWVVIRPSDWEQNTARILLSLGTQASGHLTVPKDALGTRLQYQSGQYMPQGPLRALPPRTAQKAHQAPPPAQLQRSTPYADQDPLGAQLDKTTPNVDEDSLRAQLDETQRRVNEILSTYSDGIPLDFFRQFARKRTSESRSDDHSPSPIAESSKERQSAQPSVSSPSDLHINSPGREFAPQSIIGDLEEHRDGLQEHRDARGGHETSLEATETGLEDTTTSFETVEMRSRGTQVSQKDIEMCYAKIRSAAATRVTCRFRWPPLASRKTR